MYSGTSWPTNLFIQGYLHQFIPHLTINALQNSTQRVGRGRRVIPLVPPVIEVFPRSREKHGKGGDVFFTSNARLRNCVASVRLCNCFIFNRTNMQPGGWESASDISSDCVPRACALAFILVGLFPVCTSRVCCSGAWNVDCGLALRVNLCMCRCVCVEW